MKAASSTPLWWRPTANVSPSNWRRERERKSLFPRTRSFRTCPTARTSNSRVRYAARITTTIPAASTTFTFWLARRFTGTHRATLPRYGASGVLWQPACRLHLRHSLRCAGSPRSLVCERRLCERDDAGHTHRRDREARSDVDRGLSLHRHLPCPRDFGKSRGRISGCFSLLPADLRRSSGRGPDCDRPDGMALRRRNGMAGSCSCARLPA